MLRLCVTAYLLQAMSLILICSESPPCLHISWNTVDFTCSVVACIQLQVTHCRTQNHVLIIPMMLQAKSRGIVAADCQALSDVADLYSAVLHQKDVIAAFKQAAVPKLNTWVVARPPAKGPAHAAPASTRGNVTEAAAEPSPSASDPVTDATATAPTQADRDKVVENWRRYFSGVQVGPSPSQAAGPSPAAAGLSGYGQDAQVNLVELHVGPCMLWTQS